jgi:hypothetical protein
MGRAMLIGIVGLMAFGIFEQWPRQLPGWIARWALQVCAVAFVMPFSVFALYVAMTTGDMHFWKDPQRLNGFAVMTMMGLLVGPWVAVAALFRQREIQFQTQAQAFELREASSSAGAGFAPAPAGAGRGRISLQHARQRARAGRSGSPRPRPSSIH